MKSWSVFLAEDYLRCLAECNELVKVEDPETEPFKSKERAIEILEEFHDKTINSYSGTTTTSAEALFARFTGEEVSEASEEAMGLGRSVEDVLASLAFRTGALAVEAEQTSKGEKLITKALNHMEARYLGEERKEVPLKCLVEIQDANNILGTLWCNRSEHRRAEEHLKKSEKLFKDWTREHPSLSTKTGEGTDAREVEGEGAEAREKLAKNYVQTSFYLAQVYGHLGLAAQAAEYCAQTLALQLLSGEHFDRAEWAQNAAQLAGFFLSKLDYRTAERCISAADKVYSEKLEMDKKNESASEGKDDSDVGANLLLAWGKLYARQLQEGAEQVDSEEEVPPNSSPVSEAVYLWETLELNQPHEMLGVIPTNFQEARNCFNLAMPHFRKAAEYYALDGFVTEHVDLLLECSTLYKHLSIFEPDIHRQCVMHDARAKPLEHVFKQLNPKIFEGLYKQMAFELGEIFRTKMDLKKETNRPHAKVFAMGAKAVVYYSAYISAVEGSEGKGKRVHSEEERSYFSARFCLAGTFQRMYPDPKNSQDVKHLDSALKEFEGLINYGKLIDPQGQKKYVFGRVANMQRDG
eukprot:CAMPEP_0196576318 /NCGR_PEP_ID=MMETSP1081-20130531/5613_1 /TAXON_ID=36882 /ORGANISM="Pyramimonas amylifera, Strain CCMP720" /LENGTH=579 /DNA_ID=CAMNT_0041894895 /DNA_START=68 /DNA_END=1807 /DNA_ORIENTATION=-